LSTYRIAGETGNFQQNSAPPSNPSLVDDDPQAIERAEEWLYSERSPDAAGDDRFPTAVAIGIVLREQFGFSELATRELVEHWNWFGCTPKLDQRDIERAVHLAYSDPTIALELVTRPVPGVEREQTLRAAQPETQVVPEPLHGGAQAAPGPSPVGAELTAQPNDVSPPEAIVAATAPPSLTVAALVDTTTPELAIITPSVGATAPECPLCAARRKAKRERTRRWRARTRKATQLTEAADVR
jgi:hypothetical protein